MLKNVHNQFRTVEHSVSPCSPSGLILTPLLLVSLNLFQASGSGRIKLAALFSFSVHICVSPPTSACQNSQLWCAVGKKRYKDQQGSQLNDTDLDWQVFKADFFFFFHQHICSFLKDPTSFYRLYTVSFMQALNFSEIHCLNLPQHLGIRCYCQLYQHSGLLSDRVLISFFIFLKQEG